MKVLYIDDDPAARDLVQRGMLRHSIDIEVAENLGEGYERISAGSYDAIILDVVLPDGLGYDLLRRIRTEGMQVPVLMLSSRSDVEDRLQGFHLGSDDYLSKPFALRELAARVRAIARRRDPASPDDVLKVGDLEVDVASRRVERGGVRVELSPKAFAVLELLARASPRVVPRETIIERVWGWEREPRSNALTVLVSGLRKQIDGGDAAPLIHTHAGIGYGLELRSSK